MMTLAAPSHSSVCRYREDLHPGVLREIGTKDINLAVWQREVDPAGREALDAILQTQQPLALDLGTPDAAAILDELGECLGSGAGVSLSVLAEDVAGLVRLFLDLSGKCHCRLRLLKQPDLL